MDILVPIVVEVEVDILGLIVVLHVVDVEVEEVAMTIITIKYNFKNHFYLFLHRKYNMLSYIQFHEFFFFVLGQKPRGNILYIFIRSVLTKHFIFLRYCSM